MAAAKRYRRPKTKLGTLSWDSRGFSGLDVPCDPQALDAINVMARQIAAAHYERTEGPKAPNVIGMGSAIAHHLHSTDPEEWERFKGDAVRLLMMLHGSGGFSHKLSEGTWGHPMPAEGSESYFKAMHDLAEDLKK